MSLYTNRTFFFFYSAPYGTDSLLIIFVVVTHLHCANLKRQTKQSDKALCIVVVIEVAGGKAC